MAEHMEATSLIIAGSSLAGALLIGLLLRLWFGVLVHRAGATPGTWDDMVWSLLKAISLPAALTAGMWSAIEVLGVRQPVRGVLDRILVAVVILLVGLSVARLAAEVVRSVTLARSGVAQSASIFVNITRVLIIGIAVLVILQSIGVSITPLLTALGVGGLAVALALQDTLGNLFAGVHVLVSKKVQPGDFIRLDSGEDGRVVDINWRNTTVEQLTGNTVVVPNAKLADAILTNFNQPVQHLSVLVQVGVSYDSDLEEVERITVQVGREVLSTVEGAMPEYEPVVRYHTFGESSINFSVTLRVREYAAKFLVVHEFMKLLHARYRREGIEIPNPIPVVAIGNTPARPIPEALPMAGLVSELPS
ncbi:mechanosensitive ion channel family protein [Sphaerisporangium fuscum]|uniref:mechanosensitive ion channel family protein n=1 Tax=Sphaerisporangium fuscum TaxID=2835868 RepID=UPI001BDD8D4F|nr:mechanosensitive ion channel family protein [Sphaerisporangium fuscum]